MGKYIEIFKTVQEAVYSKDFSSAKKKLDDFLTIMKMDYFKASLSDKKNIQMSYRKLFPMLEELDKKEFTETLIDTLKLDRSRIPAKKEDSPKVYSPELSEGKVKKESLASENKVKKEGPAIYRPENKNKVADEVKTQENSTITKFGKGVVFGELQPTTLDDYIGQDNAVTLLKNILKASKIQNKAFPDVLFAGGFGLGKTTLASIVASELKLPFISINSTALPDAKTCYKFFQGISKPCVLFIDEIHLLTNQVQTMLLTVITDNRVTYIEKNGDTITYDLPKITILGASTELGRLVKPLINRFRVIELVEYTHDEQIEMLEFKFRKFNVKVTDAAMEDIVKRSRGIPRNLDTHCKGTYEHMLANGKDVIDVDVTNEYFALNKIDEYGLTNPEIRILKALKESHKPLSLNSLESKVDIAEDDIAKRHEPILLKMNLMVRTPQGRLITRQGKAYLEGKYPLPEDEKEISTMRTYEEIEKEENQKEDVIPQVLPQEEPVVIEETPVIEEPVQEESVAEEPSQEEAPQDVIQPLEDILEEEKAEESIPEEVVVNENAKEEEVPLPDEKEIEIEKVEGNDKE